MIHDDCQGSETQKHEKSNHVELGKMVPAGAERIDRGEEPEQKGMRKRESGKRRQWFTTCVELKSVFPELNSGFLSFSVVHQNYLKSSLSQWLFHRNKPEVLFLPVSLVPVVEVSL